MSAAKETARKLYCLVSCEHGGNRIPTAYRSLFAGHEAVLRSHRGYDPGALVLARQLAAALHAPLLASTTSRLLIDLNRSPGHPALYSEFTAPLPASLRQEIMAQHYQPYRERAANTVATAIEQGTRVLHLSSHSFTPILNEQVRHADIAFLYEPTRETERRLCLSWMAALQRKSTLKMKLRRNYPYRGHADGLCSALRRRHGPSDYIGIELEINQRYPLAGGHAWRKLRTLIISSLLEALHKSQ